MAVEITTTSEAAQAEHIRVVLALIAKRMREAIESYRIGAAATPLLVGLDGGLDLHIADLEDRIAEINQALDSWTEMRQLAATAAQPR